MSTTCIAAFPNAEGAVHVLVVKGEDGDFTSTIHLVTDFDVQGQLVYRVRTWLTALWRSPGGHLFAASANGRIHDNASGSWQVTDLNVRSGLNWIWGLDEGNMFTCGRRGVIFRYRAGQWARMSENVDGNLYGLHGSSPTDLYAVGQSGRIFHSDGTQWRRMASPTNHTFNAVYCLSPEDVYVCGTGGMLFKGSGSRWARIGELDLDLYALAMFKDKLYIGAGEQGVFAYDGVDVTVVDGEIQAYALDVSANYLAAAGSDEMGCYDGSGWDVVTYT